MSADDARPELRWPGKRGGFTPGPGLTLELEQQVGPPAATTNLLICADNLLAMDALLATHAGAVDLIYLDPPFATGHDFVHTRAREGDDGEPRGELQTHAYHDRWPGGVAGFLRMLEPRLRLAHRLLAADGSLYLHVDPTVGHYAKILLDEIFGPACFQREIVWRIGWLSGFKTRANNWIRNHDLIFFYTRDPARFSFHKQYVPHPEGYRRRDGKPPRARGVPMEDVWNANSAEFALRGKDSLDSIQIKSFSREKTGWATQKNASLLRRIIAASSRPRRSRRRLLLRLGHHAGRRRRARPPLHRLRLRPRGRRAGPRPPCPTWPHGHVRRRSSLRALQPRQRRASGVAGGGWGARARRPAAAPPRRRTPPRRRGPPRPARRVRRAGRPARRPRRSRRGPARTRRGRRPRPARPRGPRLGLRLRRRRRPVPRDRPVAALPADPPRAARRSLPRRRRPRRAPGLRLHLDPGPRRPARRPGRPPRRQPASPRAAGARPARRAHRLARPRRVVVRRVRRRAGPTTAPRPALASHPPATNPRPRRRPPSLPRPGPLPRPHPRRRLLRRRPRAPLHGHLARRPARRRARRDPRQPSRAREAGACTCIGQPARAALTGAGRGGKP
ncbi:MAG: site-specific DNA-methyltransferase [Nannocystis sp.]|nr:site-specific DNA-methyltransferase [Nannocystis sp.]